MTPHTQTVFADPARGDGHDANGVPGDCYRTAIACVIDAQSPTDVPHFISYGDSWWDETQKWVKGRGDELIYLPVPIPEDWRGWWDHCSQRVEHVILSGPSPRGKFDHVVVGTTDFKMVHDPHPSRAGLASVRGVEVYIPGGCCS
jgi:hypothetical protein